MGLSLRLSNELGLRAGGGSAPDPNIFATLPAVSVTPVRFHPTRSTVVASSGRVSTATDINGIANASAGTQNSSLGGPRINVDALGRTYWRFQGSEYLDVATGLAANNRAMSVFMVGRAIGNGGGGTNTFLSAGSAGLGTSANAGAGVANTVITSGVPPYLRGQGRSASSDATNGKDVIVGRQLQVIGVCSRSTANGDQRFYINNKVATFLQASTGVTTTGAEIGRYCFTPGSVGAWGMFDLYDIAIYPGTLSNAEADSIAAAMVSAWSIPTVTNQIVLEGDSITAGGSGTSPILPPESLGSLIGQPGAGYLASATRIITSAVSGNKVSDLVTRRDVANGIAGATLSGRNRMMVQIGRNDIANARTGAQAYADLVALLHTTTTGWLERGWEVVVAVNITSGSTLQTEIGNLRTLLRDINTFKNDSLTNTGQSFDGKLSIIDLPLITSGASGTIFDTSADALDTTWIQSDVTHPTTAGTLALLTGADTPNNGYNYPLAH